MLDAQQRDSLIDAAIAARARAYCPYSNYAVGAALLSASGDVYTGCNVENASYGLTICAERAAICSAVADGVRQFLAIAIATENGGAPCGACRQVLAEFRDLSDVDMTVLLVRASDANDVVETSIDDLLPLRFKLDESSDGAP